MYYPNAHPAAFISRPNRFIARVSMDETEHTVHVKNTGRCRELLLPGSRVWLCESANPERKTKYDLVAVEKTVNGIVHTVNIDSQAPNRAVGEWLRGGALFPSEATVRPEAAFGDSRFDFCIDCPDRICFLEVKGVTLEQDGVALFPDAPTARGVKHIRELTRCAREGMGAYILFVIQMKGVHLLRPNDATHAEFGSALRQAAAEGVKVLAVDCIVTPDSMVIDRFIPVDLSAP